MNREIIPQSWRNSFEEIREDIGDTVNRWRHRLHTEAPQKIAPRTRHEVFPDPLRDFTLWNEPHADMEEGERNLHVSIEVPGMKKDDLNVEVDGRTLTISGKKEARNEAKRGLARYSECHFGAFTRTIALPCEIETEQAKAKCRNGVLYLTLPKAKSATAKHIEVGSKG